MGAYNRLQITTFQGQLIDAPIEEERGKKKGKILQLGEV